MSVQTRVITLDPSHIDQSAIDEAADLLRAGRLVVFPTETVYGLGANALDSAAVNGIFLAKGRPFNDPLIVHLAEPAHLARVAVDVPPLAHQLAAEFWPGPLTLVLNKHPDLPANVTADLPTVAARVPDHPVARALIATVGVPVAAPSANLFSRPSPTQVDHVLQDLDGRVDLILDAGTTSIGLESTVLDLSHPQPTVLRPGGVSLERLRAHIPGLDFRPQYFADDDSVPGPGMMGRHYAPAAEVHLFVGDSYAGVLAALCARAREYIRAGRRVGILTRDDDLTACKDMAARIISLGGDVNEIGAQLFAGLRSLEAQRVDVILVPDFGQAGLALAIRDRLMRAADGRVIVVDHA